MLTRWRSCTNLSRSEISSRTWVSGSFRCTTSCNPLSCISLCACPAWSVLAAQILTSPASSTTRFQYTIEAIRLPCLLATCCSGEATPVATVQSREIATPGEERTHCVSLISTHIQNFQPAVSSCHATTAIPAAYPRPDETCSRHDVVGTPLPQRSTKLCTVLPIHPRPPHHRRRNYYHRMSSARLQHRACVLGMNSDPMRLRLQVDPATPGGVYAISALSNRLIGISWSRSAFSVAVKVAFLDRLHDRAGTNIFPLNSALATQSTAL